MAPLPQVLSFYDNYTPPIFNNTRAINMMHGSPRFSRTNHLELLFIGSSEERNEYLVGVILYTVITFLVFFIWTLVLFLLKFSGSKRVGILSGSPPRKPTLPPKTTRTILSPDSSNEPETHEQPVSEKESASSLPMEEKCVALVEKAATEGCQFDPDNSSDNKPEEALPPSDVDIDGHKESSSDESTELFKVHMKRYNSRLLCARIAVIFSGLSMIVFSAAFIEEGMNKIRITLNTAVEGLDEVSGLIYDGIGLIDDFFEEQDNVTVAIGTYQLTVDEYGWCPLKRDELIQQCNFSRNETGGGVLGSTACNVTIPFHDAVVSLETVIGDLQDAVFNEMNAIAKDLYHVIDIMDSLKTTINSFRWAIYLASGLALLVDIIVLVLLFGVVRAWTKRMNKLFLCFRSFAVIPFFLILVFLVWLFAMIFCFGSILAADFCVDGPDQRLKIIFSDFEEDFSSLTFNLIIFYLGRCEGSPFTIYSPNVLEWVVNVLLSVHDLLYDISEADAEAFYETCNASITPLAAGASFLHSQFHILANTLGSTREFFFCSNIFPVYAFIVHDAVCYQLAGALRNVYITLFGMLLCAMVFITFRAAWHEVLDQDPEGELATETDEGIVEKEVPLHSGEGSSAQDPNTEHKDQIILQEESVDGQQVG